MKRFETPILSPICIAIMLAMFSFSLNAQDQAVQVKIFNEVFPTYNMGPEQSMPYLKDFNVPGMTFFRGSRSVYPYTFINDYRPGKTDKEYEIIRLENEFIYLDIIPQLRGRIQGAVDKRNNWDFLYYNHVIKPAEISVRSAWISGGLEHNHPMGHGYTQFDKISYDIIEGKDGSKTVVIAEIEPVRMMKWEFEITLRPGQLYFETKGRLFSTEPFPVPFLSSNNAAMHTTEEMELVFPQESWASGHGFHPVRKWPYYGTDDADWNWLKNIKTQASAFADGTGLYEDYWGVYSHDEGIDAGSVMVSDHRTAPGKKYFTWGSHDFGKQWDHFLSDEDGGYVELQQQAYFANLGYGYAVLDPFEVKEFTVYWYPIMGTGGFVKATRNAAINYRRKDDRNVLIDIQPTSDMPGSTLELFRNGESVNSLEIDLEAGEIYSREMNLESEETDKIGLKISAADGSDIITYESKVKEIKPEINKLPRKGDEELTIDQLYYKGISNYHDPMGPDAEEAFNEILRRDSLESRANRQMGTVYIKRGQYEKAIGYLKRSLRNDHFESAYHTHFLLGYAYLKSGDLANTQVHLVQSSRKKAWLEGSLYYLAKARVLEGRYEDAGRLLEEIPVSKLTHPDIYNLKACVYRKLGDFEKAGQNLEKAFRIDPLNFTGWTEKMQLAADRRDAVNKINFLFDRRDSTFIGSQLYLETAQFYIELADYEAALDILSLARGHFSTTAYDYPFIDYYIGYCLEKSGRQWEAIENYKEGSQRDFTYVFPYRVKEADILKAVLRQDPQDAVAYMYYGDLMYYLRRHDEALAAWERSYALDPGNPRTARNLGVGLFVKTQETDRTIKLLEEAFVGSGRNPRVYNELEQIYNQRGDMASLEKLYDDNWDLIQRKMDFALNTADLYLRRDRNRDAISLLEGTFFNAVEKGPGQPLRHSRYAQAQTGLGEELISEGNYAEAITHLLAAYEYPEYLKEVKVENPVTARGDYLLGLAYRGDGQAREAKKYFRRAAEQDHNEISEAVVFRAKALAELGKSADGEKLVRDMLGRLEQEDRPERPESLERALGEGSGIAIDFYLLSIAHQYLGDGSAAEKHLKLARAADRDVVYKARFESSYIPVRRK